MGVGGVRFTKRVGVGEGCGVPVGGGARVTVGAGMRAEPSVQASIRSIDAGNTKEIALVWLIEVKCNLSGRCTR
jgi:hypothetical protein